LVFFFRERGGGFVVVMIEDPATSEALRTTFQTHYAQLVRLSFLLADDPSLSEDIVQDAFVRSARRIAEVDEDARFAYLRAAVLNGWRNRRRHVSVEQRWAPALGAESQLEQGAAEDRSAMWQWICALPTRQRACLVLRYYEDLPEHEIAQLLGCRTGTVKSQISRALTKLRRVVDR